MLTRVDRNRSSQAVVAWKSVPALLNGGVKCVLLLYVAEAPLWSWELASLETILRFGFAE
jgi:hypothetical protein